MNFVDEELDLGFWRERLNYRVRKKWKRWVKMIFSFKVVAQSQL